jgi:hypothetical protein
LRGREKGMACTDAQPPDVQESTLVSGRLNRLRWPVGEDRAAGPPLIRNGGPLLQSSPTLPGFFVLVTQGSDAMIRVIAVILVGVAVASDVLTVSDCQCRRRASVL